jgi:hypothetical protein
MNRTVKDTTVRHCHYDDHPQLKQHAADLIAAYNCGRRRESLKGLAPYDG